jgi:hypothetical protein
MAFAKGKALCTEKEEIERSARNDGGRSANTNKTEIVGKIAILCNKQVC